MDIEQQRSVQFIPTAPAFAICGVCDTQFPPGTPECPKCKSPLSIVRKCPHCERIVSAKHERCLYCSMSFVAEGETSTNVGPEPLARKGIQPDPIKQRRAVLVSVAVFLTVMFLGLFATMRKISPSGSAIAATSYVLRGAPLRLQPNSNAGTSTTLDSGTVVSLTGMALDAEGNRWYVIRQQDGRDLFLKVSDVAPPKARLPDMGAQMLRAWLLGFSKPDLVPEAESAVDYFCIQYPSSSHCGELRMAAGDQFRSISQRTGSSDALNGARRMYQRVADAHVDSSAEAANKLAELDNLGGMRGRAGQAISRSKLHSSGARTELGSGSEYSLVDRAEVHVEVPTLRALGKSQQIRVPISREIRVNGRIAVPSTAICVLKISEPRQDKLEVQLTAIEIGNKIYPVRTSPQEISNNGATVVFPLDSPLLVGK